MAKEENKAKKAFERLKKINPSVSYLKDSSLTNVKEWIDTGSLVLNALMSGSLYGGVPTGRLVEFAAPSQCFKSGFCLKIAANAQKMGKTVIIFDSEGAVDEDFAKAMGVDTEELIQGDVETLEQVRNDIYNFLKEAKNNGETNEYVIIIDSVANMLSKMEISRMEKDKDSADMGTKAKAVKSLLTMCNNMATSTKTTIIFTNHVYDDPSAMYPSIEKDMPGGKSVVYLPSVIVQLARKPMKEGDDSSISDKKTASQKNFAGIILRALTVKNRFVQQYLEGEVYLSFKKGLNRYYGLLEIMKGMGVVSNAGATYTDWTGEKLGYYKNWVKDKDLWETKLLPELEIRIKKYWKYSSVDDEEEVEEVEEIENLEDDDV